mgnify:CR=1 FL=1
MEKKTKIIFYTELLSKIEKKQNQKTIKLNNFQEAINKIKKTNKKKKIEIWGATTTTKHKENEILNVNDHINFTGNNPLIGKQNQIKIE